MDLVNEQDRRLTGIGQAVGGAGQDAAHVGHIRLDAAEPLELVPRVRRDNLSQRSFARARRAVEDERLDAIRLDGPAQQFAGPEDMRLSDKLA